MDVQALDSLPDELAKFASAISTCAMTKPSQRHCLTYLAGQVTDRPRKSVEPIALAAKIPPRTLQEFMSLHRWDEEAVDACLQERLAGDHAYPQAIAIVDEASFAKKGDQSPGVQRQWCGATGKVDNCMVSVHVIARTKFKSRDQARREVFSFIVAWFNPRRRHSALGYKSPNEFEATTPVAALSLTP